MTGANRQPTPPILLPILFRNPFGGKVPGVPSSGELDREHGKVECERPRVTGTRGLSVVEVIRGSA